ncbi:conserved hypothetical protein [delta proteobacterium NaphS2]|nr:conserved hypothetical protein [delta proteobacterium NaphS2]
MAQPVNARIKQKIASKQKPVFLKRNFIFLHRVGWVEG